MKRKKSAAVLLLAALMTGCGSESSSSPVRETSASVSASVTSADITSASLTSAGAVSEAEPGDTGSYRQISQEEALEIMRSESGCIILDVRREDEFAAGHIKGAICIPNETIEDTPPPQLPDKSQLILVYCRSGRRSKEASQKLADMGYTDIREFGGILTWQGETETGS